MAMITNMTVLWVNVRKEMLILHIHYFILQSYILYVATKFTCTKRIVKSHSNSAGTLWNTQAYIMSICVKSTYNSTIPSWNKYKKKSTWITRGMRPKKDYSTFLGLVDWPRSTLEYVKYFFKTSLTVELWLITCPYSTKLSVNEQLSCFRDEQNHN